MIRPNLLTARICEDRMGLGVEQCANLTGTIQTRVQESVAEYEATYSAVSFVPK